MSVIRTAIPLVLILVLLELLWGLLRRQRVYRMADTLADFGCAAMSQVVGLSVTAVTIGGYASVAGALNSSRAELAGTPLLWITVFLLVDLGQYLLHRLSHRVNLLWACHMVHHSSEEFNYAVGLRNSSFHGFLLWVFFLPLAIAGVPWRIVAVCYGLNVLYQFVLHTRLIGRMGPLELLLNTPSHHRVHHGTDQLYIDRNFGGVLIIWDRLFRTFRPESAEPHYGSVTPLGSWNPVWANFQGFALISQAWRRSPDWRGRMRVLLGPPDLLKPRLAASVPVVPRRGIALYAAGHLILTIAVIFGLVLPTNVSGWWRLGAGTMALGTLGVLGGLLDGKRWARPAEAARLLALAVAGLNIVETSVRLGLLLVGVASALWLTVVARENAGSNLQKAKSLGVEVIDEAELLKRVSGSDTR
jgi:sterol desaturase/sphingolipid hydroxylase (fatty acid hydroxylase superfamily)